MIEDPKAHFESKYKLAQKEISAEAPLLTMHYRNRTKQGFIFITKNRSETKRWKMFKQGRQSIIICGTGRHLDFIKFSNWLRHCIKDFGAIYRLQDLNLVNL